MLYRGVPNVAFDASAWESPKEIHEHLFSFLFKEF